jgi:hypothetical protein
MTRLLAIFAACGVALGVVIGAMGHALLAPTPATVRVTDTLAVRVAPDTVRVSTPSVVVRRVVVREIDTCWLHDTTADSTSVATIDTTMQDGALIGVRAEAVLIRPPMRLQVAYTPPARVERTIEVPVIQYRTDWQVVTIASMAGILTGVAVERLAGK